MYQVNDIVAGSDGYYRVVADGVKGMRLQFDRPYIVGEIVPSFGMVQTPQDSPKTHGARKVVHVCHIDGYLETDEAWLANQDGLDLAATMDAASYRGQ